MTDATHELLLEIEALDLEYQTIIKPFFERRDALLARIEQTLEVGEHWQADDGTAFEIQTPTGTYVSFRRIGWERTRRAYMGEKKGGLSLKAAEALGYTLGPNQRTVTE